MQISSALAGYSLGKADLLRRAMGKKKAEVMAKEKAGFLDGAKAKAVDSKVAERVFDLMEKFAGYGFNRSHSAAYGLLTYQTALPEALLPGRVLRGAADLRQGRHRRGREVHRRGEGERHRRAAARRQRVGHRLLGRQGGAAGKARRAVNNANRKRRESSAKKVIRFGLGAVKGVGEGAVDVVKVGARAGRAVPVAVRFLQARRRAQGEPQGHRGAGQGGRVRRCGGGERRHARADVRARSTSRPSARPRRSASARAARPTCWRCSPARRQQRRPGPRLGEDKYPAAEEWMPKELLAYEKESLGFYISGHPLDRYTSEIRRFTTATCANCMEKGERNEVILGGRHQRLRRAAR